MNLGAQFLACSCKVFHLNQLVQGIGDARPQPAIPTRPILLSLLLGVVLRSKSRLQVATHPQSRPWQRLIHWHDPISDDTFEYVAERFHLPDLRRALATVARQLKTNQALESCKINGLLFVSLDANEHFKSRSRCSTAPSSRCGWIWKRFGPGKARRRRPCAGFTARAFSTG